MVAAYSWTPQTVETKKLVGKDAADEGPPIQALAGRALSQAQSSGAPCFFDRCLADDFLAFLRKVFETVCPERAFRETWLVECMAHAAESIIDGKTKRLIVNVPPRHLKSINFTVALPAFLLGRDPTMRIICVSYSNELAIKHAIDFRAVVNAPWFKRAFPNTKISREKDTQHETMTTARAVGERAILLSACSASEPYREGSACSLCRRYSRLSPCNEPHVVDRLLEAPPLPWPHPATVF
jgi:hypothetical protein